MHYEYLPEYVEMAPTDDEYGLIRKVVKKQLTRAATGGLRLENLEAWRLADFLDKTTATTCRLRASPDEIPYYADALALALPDLEATEMQLAQTMISGMTVAREGFELLRDQVATPDCIPLEF